MTTEKRKMHRSFGVLMLALLLILSLTGCEMLFLMKSDGRIIEEQDIGIPPLTGTYDVFISPSYASFEFNTVEHGTIQENTWKSVKLDPFSTFAADVDTAAYATVRRYLLSGQLPPKDAVRIEEMINYFKYDYPSPAGDMPFGISMTLTDTPWNEKTKLLVVGIKANELDVGDRKPSNFVYLIDVSGSMFGSDKLGLVKQAFHLLTEQLGPDDTVSIVTYAGSDQVLADGLSGNDKLAIMQIIDELEAGGSTHGSKGIVTAYELAEKYFDEEKNNRVILATDGDLNVGVTSEGELVELIEERRETGVFLSVMGFGFDNLKDSKLEALADHGNGNYAYIDSVLEAKKLLVDDMGATLHTIAKDVKFQIEFNPALIKGYRLVGYENRLLNDEDFVDDQKDGGEVGEGHRVTVIYEIAEHDSEQMIPIVEGRYEHSNEGLNHAFDDELLTVNIRYKDPASSTSELLTYQLTADTYAAAMDDNQKLAAAIVQFGMLLRDSEHKGTATYDGVLDTLHSLNNKDDYINELIYLVSRAKRMTALANGESVQSETDQIDDIDAIGIAKRFIMELDVTQHDALDLSTVATAVLTEETIPMWGDALDLDGNPIESGTMQPGDFFVGFGDAWSLNYLVVIVSATTGEVIATQSGN